LRPPERKYLFDIAEACSLIADFTTGKSFDDYIADAMLRSAVERQFEIAGEALSQLLQLAPEITERITDARRIVAFRNRLIHGYASVADEVVWGIVERNLTVLRNEVASLLNES
jgi:uncharacterized protein with HEPN domain